MGSCIQHMNPDHITFNTIADVERLGKMVANRKVHLGSESSVISLTAMGGGHTLLVVAFRRYKENNPVQQRRVLDTVRVQK